MGTGKETRAVIRHTAYSVTYKCTKYPYLDQKKLLHSGGILICPFLSLRVNKLSPWSLEWGSEVKPDTGRHGVTGLGHLDFSSKEQMFAAAV